MTQNSALGARVAQSTNERAGVDTLHSRYIPAVEKILEAAARLPVVRVLRQLADNEPAYPGPHRFVARIRDAIVANLRMRHHHHLAAVRRVGDDLLVTGDAGVEHDLRGNVRH